MKHDESIIQAAIVKELRSLGIFCFMVPNDLAGNNAMAQSRAITLGLYPGVSDLIALLPNGRCVFLEVKTETGKQSDRQEKFETKVKALGFDYHVVRSVNQAIDVIGCVITGK